MNTETKKYAFILGRERELCLSELKAVLKRFCFDFDILSVTENIVLINITALPLEVAHLIGKLAGTIKIFKIISDSPEKPADTISNHLRDFSVNKGKVVFGISVFLASHLNLTTRSINRLGFQIKKELKNRTISSRFLELKDSTEVSTILSLKEKLIGKGIEYGLMPGGLGVLIAVTNPEEWSHRDYNKPAGDKRSGMLPPKLARIMLNLALGQAGKTKDTGNSELEIPQHKVLIADPFCGSGNVVLEAMLLGYDVIGSDLSQKAVNDTKMNIEWLQAFYTEHPLDDMAMPSAFVMQADATTLDLAKIIENFKLKIEDYQGLAIVAEPYLGEPKKFQPSLNAARGEYKKIKELYLKFLRNIKSCLDACQFESLADVLCLVFPLIETSDHGLFSLFSESVDEIRQIGYTLVQNPLVYGRDYQVVKREIVLLSLNSKK